MHIQQLHLIDNKILQYEHNIKSIIQENKKRIKKVDYSTKYKILI